MAYERYLTQEDLADRISRWRPIDGPLVYFASASFTADAPDVQKFDVSSSSDSVNTENRAKASRYTVGDITDMDKCCDEVTRAYGFLAHSHPQSLFLFEATAPVVTLRIILGAIQGNNTYGNVINFEKELGLDFSPYWKQLLEASSNFGKYHAGHTLRELLATDSVPTTSR